MMSQEVRIARIQAEAEVKKTLIEETVRLLTNPSIALVAGFVLVEVLQAYPETRPILGKVSGTSLQVALSLPAFASALGQAATVVRGVKG